MMPAANINSGPQAVKVYSPQLSLLVVSSLAPDSRLRSIINPKKYRVSEASTIAELGERCREPHDIVVVDVGPASLTSVLKTIRANPFHDQIPVLVMVSGIPQDERFAGVLPLYRAMPCSLTDIAQLLDLHSGCSQQLPTHARIL